MMNSTLKIKPRTTCYEQYLYFVPKFILEEYNKHFPRITAPILKRKLSAMIYASMDYCEKVKEDIYNHKFNTVELVVNAKTKTVINLLVRDKKETLPPKVAKTYHQLCKMYELNADRNDFVGMKKTYIYTCDNLFPVKKQLLKEPNKVLWSDNGGKSWNSYVDSIGKEGFSVINGERVDWIYTLK